MRIALWLVRACVRACARVGVLWNEEADVLGVLTVLRTGLHSMSPCGRRPARLSRGGARCCPSFFHCHSFFTARCLSFLAVLLPLLQCCSVGSSFCSPGSSLLSLLLAAVCATGSVAFSPRVCCVYYCLWCVCGCVGVCVCVRALAAVFVCSLYYSLCLPRTVCFRQALFCDSVCAGRPVEGTATRLPRRGRRVA